MSQLKSSFDKYTLTFHCTYANVYVKFSLCEALDQMRGFSIYFSLNLSSYADSITVQARWAFMSPGHLVVCERC